MTTRRLMIAVAVIGIEAALITSVAGKLGGDPRSSPWPQIVFCLAVPPTLVFLRHSAAGEPQDRKRVPSAQTVNHRRFAHEAKQTRRSVIVGQAFQPDVPGRAETPSG